MATQITHIAAADKVFTNYFLHYSKKDFYIGTVFPDIRYLGDVTRNQTHVYELTLQDIISEKNSFEAGCKFHCLIDLVREDFFNKEGLQELFICAKDKNSVAKFREDELSYLYVSEWPEIINFFDEVVPEELKYKIPPANINKWHQNLQKYFKYSPNDQTRIAHGVDLGFSLERIEELNRNVALLRNNQEATLLLNRFYIELESLLERWK